MKQLITRRDLAKGIAAAAAMSGSSVATAAETQADWKEVGPGIWRARIGTPERFSPVKCRTIPPSTKMQSLPSGARPLTALEGSVNERGTHIQLPLEAGELVYGFGLQMHAFEHRGRKRIMRTNADPKSDSGDTHAPVPFYVTTRGYGIFVDTFRQAQFHVAVSYLRPTAPSGKEGTSVNTAENAEHVIAAKKAYVRVEVPRSAGVDVYLFSGPQMMDAVRRYNLFSGGGVEPPLWGLGVWYRAEAKLTAAAVLGLAREFRERKIPCDVLGLEPGWQTHAYSCSYVWEKSRYPDPSGFLNECNALGYKVNLWEHAYTHPSSPIFTALTPYSGDFAVWGGLVPDFAGAHAKQIFSDYHAKALVTAGVASFKLDECDNSDFTGGWSFPEFAKFPSGLDGEQMHACLGLRYQDAVWDAYRKTKKSTYGLVRSSGALSAPYPFVLYSDLYDHRQYIRALVNSGFCGLLWTPEVRDAGSEEDLIRRLQSVVFSPLAQVDAWYIANPPWKQINRKKNNAGEFTEGWERTEEKCREILGWRLQMLPYLRKAFARYANDGTPPFRALVLDFPGEASLAKVDDQYMMGESLMVAPLFAREPGRSVVMPRGRWYDFWTGEAVEGGRSIEISATREHIPLYVKGDIAIPWANVGSDTADPVSKRVTMRMYGNAEHSEATLSPEYQIMNWLTMSESPE